MGSQNCATKRKVKHVILSKSTRNENNTYYYEFSADLQYRRIVSRFIEDKHEDRVSLILFEEIATIFPLLCI